MIDGGLISSAIDIAGRRHFCEFRLSCKLTHTRKDDFTRHASASIQDEYMRYDHLRFIVIAQRADIKGAEARPSARGEASSVISPFDSYKSLLLFLQVTSTISIPNLSFPKMFIVITHII